MHTQQQAASRPAIEYLDLRNRARGGAIAQNPKMPPLCSPLRGQFQTENSPRWKGFLTTFYDRRRPKVEARDVREPSRISEATKAAISPPREHWANEQTTSATRSTDTSSSDADSDESIDIGSNSSVSEDEKFDTQSEDKSKQVLTSPGSMPVQRSNSKISKCRHQNYPSAPSFSSQKLRSGLTYAYLPVK